MPTLLQMTEQKAGADFHVLVGSLSHLIRPALAETQTGRARGEPGRSILFEDSFEAPDLALRVVCFAAPHALRANGGGAKHFVFCTPHLDSLDVERGHPPLRLSLVESTVALLVALPDPVRAGDGERGEHAVDQWSPGRGFVHALDYPAIRRRVGDQSARSEDFSRVEGAHRSRLRN